MSIHLGPPVPAWTGPAFFASGHRPFFLVAGLWAASAPLLWLAAWRGFLPLSAAWHGHEMLFGFAVAAIAGFLQAAVPKWTDSPPFRGAPVAALLALWIAGRVGMAVPGLGWLDLAFLPVFAVLILLRIVRARDRRNYPVPALLLTLSALNGLYHAGDTALALRLVTLLVGALIVLIAGRIVPTFTRNALKLAGDPQPETHTPPWLDRLALPSVVVVAITEWAWPLSRVSGLAAAIAGVLLAWRMAGWRTRQTLRQPLVWVLHVGYAFLPLGLLLKAAVDLGAPVPFFPALHALTAGAIGVMILAVASRAALGHSGRPLEPSRATVVAYWLVIAGALLRVVAPHPHAVLLAGCLWSAGYAVFSAVYWPILTRPRVDGQPG